MGEGIGLHVLKPGEPSDEDRRRVRLGAMIRLARGELTQAELGRRVGVGQPAISAWEAGSVALSAETLWSIEEALGLKHGWLVVAGGLADPGLEPLLVLLEASVRQHS